MKSEFSIALIIALPAAALAVPVDQRTDAAADGHVMVQNIAGDVIVSGWDDNVVHVTGEISDQAERLEVRRDGNDVYVEVIYPDNWQGGRNSGSDTDLIVRIPRGSSLNVDTVSADLMVSDVDGELQLNSVSGDILASDVAAEAQFHSVSGDIGVTGRNVTARTSANAVSGDVGMNQVSGEIAVGSVSGDIEIESGLIERAALESVSGDVFLRGELGPDARITATSTSGDIELEFVGTADAQYNLSSFSGDIENCFGPTARQSEFGPPNSTVRFTEGDSDASVEVSTMSGDIGLCR